MSDNFNHKDLLTGLKDLDREILNKISDDDRTLFTMCKINKTFYKEVCNEDFFRNRTLARYPETVKYKDSIKFRNCKNHYLNVVVYIDKLKTHLKYKYQPEDKSPELLYIIKNIFGIYYNKDRVLIWAVRLGFLPVVKYLIEQGAEVNSLSNADMKLVKSSKHLDVYEYLQSLRK